MTGPLARAAELLLLLVILTNFALLGMSRISACIRAVAVQGALLGVVLLVIHPVTWHTVALAVGVVAVKAVALPVLLRWAMREAAIRREVEPLVGYLPSLALGAIALGVAFTVVARLPAGPFHELLFPVALFTLIVGLVVLVTRVKAVMQVLGYLVLENGVYLFGQTQTVRVPFLVEIGVLLDVFVGVFIMGIVVFHINRAFDSMSSERLTELRDS